MTSNSPVDMAVGWESTSPPLPIRNKLEHREALNETRRLGRLVDTHKATRLQADTCYVLTLLVVDYENRRFGNPDQPAWGGTPVDRLRYLMEEHKMGAVALGEILGDRSLSTRILSGERELSKAHIRKLAEHFHVNPAYFL